MCIYVPYLLLDSLHIPNILKETLLFGLTDFRSLWLCKPLNKIFMKFTNHIVAYAWATNNYKIIEIKFRFEGIIWFNFY